MSESYAGQQIVGIDLHRCRSVIVRMTETGEHLETVRILNDRERLAAVMAQAGESPEVVLEATYGWYWAADALAELGANVHLAHLLGVKMFSYRRVKNDQRDAADLTGLLGDGSAARGLDRPAGDPGAAALGAAPGQAGRAALEPEVPGPRGARWRRRHGGDERPVRG
ncbi:MAG: transposase, partial [Actinomycetota bacterium]|nr:transposase [Actinomycetota bacterium]